MVEDIPFEFIIDLGATCNIIDSWQRLHLAQPPIQLHETQAQLLPYETTRPMKPLGLIYRNTWYRNKKEISRICVSTAESIDCLLDKTRSSI